MPWQAVTLIARPPLRPKRAGGDPDALDSRNETSALHPGLAPKHVLCDAE
jgi:hypothetical protein